MGNGCLGGECQYLGDSVHVARMYITGVLLLGLPVAVLVICTVPGGYGNIAGSGCASTGGSCNV